MNELRLYQVAYEFSEADLRRVLAWTHPWPFVTAVLLSPIRPAQGKKMRVRVNRNVSCWNA